MGISRRLIDLARAELNSLLDRAADEGDAEPMGSPAAGGATPATREPPHGPARPLQDLSDAELAAEIERRHGAAKAPPPRARRSPGPAGGHRDERFFSEEMSGAYAVLELPVGSDFEAVRSGYRALMRKYHPDRHGQTPETLRIANEVAQKLTEAYRLLEKRLRP